ncbi:ATP-binding cassette domain-containing protein (plasmid) [Haloimpatiens sp. FM7330]|uniref:ATP-binding cassette domain-containing protein n=1 Tax=Haloimpatiens sp. FM7330 TaxID=3298610 RepID=UPI0036316768
MKKYILKLKSIIFIKIISDSIYIVAIAGIPYIIKMLFDYDFSKGSSGVVKLILLYLFAVGIGMAFQYISQLHAWKLERKFNLLIRGDIVKSILEYDYKKFIERKISEYISIINNDVEVSYKYISSAVDMVQSIIQIFIYGFYMFSIDKRIAIIIICCSLLTLFLPNLTSKELSSRRKEHLDYVGSYIGKIKDLLEGFTNVNYETKDKILDNHNKTLLKTENKLLYYGKFSTFANVFNGICMYLLDISAFVLVAVLLLKKEITIGTATATIAYIKEFTWPIRYIINDLTTMKSTKGINEKLIKLINEKGDTLDKKIDFNSNIKFSNVSVDFDNFKMDNFNFTFEKGKKYAIIGHSGSGKSTVINLLMKYTESSCGNITIDGEDIRKIDCNGIIACINQFEHVFADDFLNNVTIFKTYEEEKVGDIINYYQCDKLKDISRKEDCTELSGGEKQLLSLVKMKLLNRDIMILDEPFSALDFVNTLLMQNKVYTLDKKTMIVVTHDLSENNLAYFDEVIIIDDGHIIKSGASKEVLKSEEYNTLISDVS